MKMAILQLKIIAAEEEEVVSLLKNQITIMEAIILEQIILQKVQLTL